MSRYVRELRRLAMLLLLGVLAALSVSAGEVGPQPLPPAPVIREQKVFVPFDKAEELFSENRGVYLPYEQFLKLTQPTPPDRKDPEAEKPPAEAVITQASFKGEVRELVARIRAEFTVRALKDKWAQLPLAFRNVALESIELSDPKALLIPGTPEGYKLVLPTAGEFTLKVTFSTRVESKPGLRQFNFGIPASTGSKLELALPGKDLRVDLSPKSAVVKTEPLTEAGKEESTQLTAFLGRASDVAISWMPPESADVAVKGEALLTATQGLRVELGERVLRLQAQTILNVERGETDRFRYKLPANWRLLSVKGDNIRDWNVDNGRLTVQLHSAVKGNFPLGLRFERILDQTPDKLDLEFPSVLDALREDGYLTLYHDVGLRLKAEKVTGLMQIDAKDLPAGMVEPNLFAAYRYPSPPLGLSLTVERVLPQINSETTALLDLGVDEDSLTGMVALRVEKAGIFSIKLKVPSRWETASIGTPEQLEDFQTEVDGEFKIITANFKTRLLGPIQLPFRFTAPGQGKPGSITAIPLTVLGVKRDTGLLGVAAPKMLKLSTGERDKMSSANVQTLLPSGLPSRLPGDHDLPLAFQYTQTPAQVGIALEVRQTEIRATGFHAITVSEAGIDHLHKLEYLIQYAATDKLSFSAPATLDDKLQVVCPNLKEKRKAGTKEGRTTWEISLQEKTLGAVPVTISFQENFGGLEPEKPRDVEIAEIRAEDVKSQQGFVAVRKESALELAPDKPVGLEPLEAVNLPAELRATNMYLAYRYFQPERKLTLSLTRHVPVQTASTVVDLARVTYVLSTERRLFVKAEFWVSNTKGDQYLALGLPAEASIRYLAVGGVQASPLKNKEGHTLIKLPANSAAVPVQVVYGQALASDGATLGRYSSIELPAPAVFGQVPIGKTEVALFVPEDYAYWGFSPEYRLRSPTDNISNALARIHAAVRGPSAGRSTENSFRIDSAPDIMGAFQTQGRLFELETLGQGTAIRFVFCQRKIFLLIGVLSFVLVLGIGMFSYRKFKGGSPMGWICVALFLVPLCLSWFAEGDAGEPYTAAYLGGLLLCVLLVYRRGVELWRARRDALLDSAPDPFIEDASPIVAGLQSARTVAATPEAPVPEKDEPASSEAIPEKTEDPQEKNEKPEKPEKSDKNKKPKGGGK